MENGYGTVEEFFKRQYMQALVDIAKDSIPQVKRLLKSVKRNHIPGIGKKAVEWGRKICSDSKPFRGKRVFVLGVD